ncbi:unnamed protein product, partial [Prorocentrum cordatum]
PEAAAADVLPQLVFSQLPEAAAALGPGQASDNNPPDSVRAGDGRLSSAASEATEDAECVATLAEVRGAAGASGPSGWRMLELTGAPEAPAGRAERGGRARAALRMGRQASWRDTEVAGACECPSVMESPRQQEPEAAPRAAPRWPVPPVPLPSGVPPAPLPRGEAGPGGAPPSDSPRREEDWRWDELCGAGTARGSLRKAVAVQKVESSSASSGKRPGRLGQRMQWRDAEVLAAHSAVHRAQPEATPASAEQPATGSAASGHGAGEAAAGAGEEGPQQGDAAEDVRPHEGDIVRISADPDYSQRSAVVTKVGENHCTVVVLDASERFGVDERYPYFKNIRLVNSAFRLRNRVAVAGLKGARTRHLNGHTGSIERHPTNGHPVFVTVQKPPAPDKTQLIFKARRPRQPGGPLRAAGTALPAAVRGPPPQRRAGPGRRHRAADGPGRAGIARGQPLGAGHIRPGT